METTSAGCSAAITNCAGSGDQMMMSICSPAISLRTAVTREPRRPTQVPIGSMRGSCECTAILARRPGSRAQPLISSSSSSISGTSSSNSLARNSGAVRDRISCGPRALRSIRSRKALTRSPTRRFSRGTIWSRGITASRRPISMIALPRSMRLIVPETMCSLRSRKSLSTCSRSASRIFCRITCLAAWAPTRPNSIGSSGSSM